MLDAKQAVQVAKEHAVTVLGKEPSDLEELERSDYHGRDVWVVTLSVPRNLDKLPPLVRMGANPFDYKRFMIDVQTGEFVAMKLREPAA